MPARFFDVVVLGTRLGALATAALLTRRDFRVLVLGHGARPASYRYDGLPLRRRSFSPTFTASPAWRRQLAEMAQSQSFRRRSHPLDPMFQLMIPRDPHVRGGGGLRLDVPPDPERFSRELARALPTEQAGVEELHAALARLAAHVDPLIEADAVWPPGTFWERRETHRLRDALPEIANLATRGAPLSRRLSSRAEDEDVELARASDLAVLAEAAGLPRFRLGVALPAQFSTHLAYGDAMPALPLARLSAQWTRGPHGLAGDGDELAAFLIERIRAAGGDVRENDRCEAILAKNGRIEAVALEAEGEIDGCNFVIGDRATHQLLSLVRDEQASPVRGLVPAAVLARRFVVSVIVRRAMVPPTLGEHSFLAPRRATHDGGVHVHLQRASFATASTTGASDPGLAFGDAALDALEAELWVAEAILPEPGEAAPGVTSMPWPGGRADLRARQAVLATLRDHFPFLDAHALVIDSPHDGGALVDARGGAAREIDRATFRATGASLEAEPAEPLYRPWSDGFAGICGESVRSPLERLLAVGPTVVPALGLEGELMAAWGAARIVTKSDRRRERMRREMWSKIEL
jgi:hypothetical protein